MNFPEAGAGVRLKNPLAAGGKAVALRLPSDEEWSALVRRMERVRGQSEDELALSDALFRELAPDASGVDPDAANYLLGRVTRLELRAAKIDPDQGDFVVKGEALGGVAVTFRFRLPSVGRLRDDGDALRLPAAVRLFDEFISSAEGYAGKVPNYHKHVAAGALREGLFLQAAEVEEADFFDLTDSTSGEAATGAAA